MTGWRRFLLLGLALFCRAQSSVSVATFGAQADAIMRTDGAMIAGSAILTSASGSFVSADVGKYVQMIGAGAGGTSHTANMSTGSATLTSPSGSFASTDVGRGIIVLGAGSSGGNLVTTIAAYKSATTVVLNATAASPVAGATFFYGAMTLEGNIQSIESNTTVTLSATAGATATGATFVYGTDNHVAFQSAVDSVGQSGGGTVNVPQPSSCPNEAVCGYVIKATDQMTAQISAAVKIRYNNVSLVGASPQTNLFCRGAWSTYFNSVQFPGQTAAVRGGCLNIGDNAGPNGAAGEAISNITVSHLHLYGMTNGNTYNVSFDPTVAPLLTTGDGWDITHKGIHLWDNSVFSNITIDSVVIQDFKGENIFSGGSVLTGMVISNSTLMNFNGDGISMLAAGLQVINNTISNGSNAGIENSTMGATPSALVLQLYQGNSISLMPREGINIVGVDSVLASGFVQIVSNSFTTIGQINGSGAQAGIFINPQANGNVAPGNVTISGNMCTDCYSFGNLETSGTTTVSGNTFVVNAYNCNNFLSFTFTQTNVTISGNNGYLTNVGVANARTLGSVYMLDPGYQSGNFDWTNLVIGNNLWNFPGVPNYTFVTSSGPGFRILTGRNVVWQGDSCSGCTYPDIDHGLVNLSIGSTIEPYGPVVYVTGNTAPVTATVDASKEQGSAQVKIVNAGASAVTFTSDSNLSLSTPVTLPGNSSSSVLFVFNASIGKFVQNAAVGITVSPQTGALSENQTLQLTATVTGTVDTAVTWQILNGGAGTVSSSGLYTAPSTIGSQQQVAVQAISAADTTKTAYAAITLLPVVTSTISRVGIPAMCVVGGNVSSASCPYTASAGNFLVVTCSSQASQVSFRVTDARSNVYAQDGFASNGAAASIFHAANVMGGAVNPTCTSNAPAGNGLVVAVTEYSGVVTLNPVDGTPSSLTGMGDNAKSGSTLTTGSSDLLVAAAISDSAPNCNKSKLGSGWNQVQLLNNEQSYCFIYADRLSVSSGTYQFTTTFTNSNDWAAIIAGYR